jgi:hypothetical protein
MGNKRRLETWAVTQDGEVVFTDHRVGPCRDEWKKLVDAEPEKSAGVVMVSSHSYLCWHGGQDVSSGPDMDDLEDGPRSSVL